MEQDKLIELISILQTYIIKSKEDVDKFIINNSSIYENYVIYNKILNESEFKFLYNIIEKDPSLNHTVIYNIFKLSQISFNKDVYISKLIYKPETQTINKDIHTFNYMRLLNNVKTFEPIPKFINLLWDTKNKLNNNIDEINKIDINSNKEISSNISISKINIKYISYDYLHNYLEKNRAQIILNKKFNIYDNLNRVIGVPISNTTFKLIYTIILRLEKFILLYNIFNSISYKKIVIHGYGIYSVKDIKGIINDTVNEVSSFIVSTSNSELYHRMYCCCYFLSCYYEKLFKQIPLEIFDRKNYSNTIYLDSVNKIKYEVIICEHVSEYKKVFREVENFFKNTNKFLEKFIIFQNKIAICKICGESLDMFNFEEANYIQSRGEIIITTSKDSIFQYETYSGLINAELFLTEIIGIYDDIFNTNRMDDFNNIARIIIDFFIDINKNRLKYQEKYKQRLSQSKLFFIRLTNNLFISFYNEKEQYAEERQINMFIIIGICLILLSNFNELINIIQLKKDIGSIFIQESDLKVGLDKFIISTVRTYLIKQKIIDKKTNIGIDIIVNTYLEILTDELKSFYNIILNRFYKNIDVLKYEYVDIPDMPLLKYKSRQTSFINLTNFNYKIFYLPLEDIKHYENPKVEYQDMVYINLQSLNSLNFEKFSKIENQELKSIINLFSYEYYYKNISINEIKQINQNNFYLDNGQKYFFTISEILTSSPILLKINEYFMVFNFADTLPFLDILIKPHYMLLFENFNIFLNFFFPGNIFIFDDVYLYISRDYFHYIIYNILSFLINESVNNWILLNSNNIVRLFNDLIKFYITE